MTFTKYETCLPVRTTPLVILWVVIIVGTNDGRNLAEGADASPVRTLAHPQIRSQGDKYGLGSVQCGVDHVFGQVHSGLVGHHHVQSLSGIAVGVVHRPSSVHTG